MKKILLLLILSSCGYQVDCVDGCKQTTTPAPTITSDKDKNVGYCTVSSSDDGALISCPDGTSAFIKNGEDGKSIQGLKGDSGTTGAEGPKGLQGEQGIQGPMGPVGPQGVAGKDGLNGGSCTVVYTAVGATISCPDGTSVNILNGVNGNDGSSVSAIKLCADSSAGFPEYGFQIGEDIYAVYYGYLNAQGQPATVNNGTLQAFLAKLKPGAYQSTNGTGCRFTINNDGTITR